MHRMKVESTLTPPRIASKLEEIERPNLERVATIDILRALTMVLMIFVNDLWSLTNIPAWLGHVDRGVDGIGLADVVFPAFLFIVGLSIPYALDNRRKKGDSESDLVKHVLWRTLALLVMGLFLVNGESINAVATGMPRFVWGPICCLCFILIWNDYPKKTNRILVHSLRGLAIVTLLVLAIIYRGGPNDNIYTFGPRWWGILGMIGWAYLLCGLIAIAAKNRLSIIVAAWIGLSILSMVSQAELLPDFILFLPAVLRDGTHAGLTMGGVLTTLIFRRYRERNDNIRLTFVLLGFAAVLIILSILTRPYWGLAKLGATPAWLFLCSAFTILAFLVVYWIADVYRKDFWFDIVKPAGTATLLCYLIPYFAYFTTRILGIRLPDIVLSGSVGLLKSFLFALLCVFITGVLIRLGVRVRL